ncbi:MAG: hypothetical protein JSS30_04935 [Verrucomicrobia bacterium]|nr:hypothetical protein [Verrucomicrobiota bacterium]
MTKRVLTASKIGTVISFCTHDIRFLDRNIKAVRRFSSQIVIPVCDHFYNGKKEDLELLQKVYQNYPDVDFVEFAYSEEEVYGTPAKLVRGSPDWAQHWHNSARLVGSYFLRPEIDAVLFVDTDEIFTADIPQHDYHALRFATYWYFRSASQCATVTPDGPLLIQKKLLSTELLLNPHERMGMFEQVQGKKEREFCVDGKPIVNHYSWVRTHEEMLNKVRTWGHHWERDWEKLMKSEGDFVRKYDYREVEVDWDPLRQEISYPEIKGIPNNVTKVNPNDIFRMEIKYFIT